MAEDRGNRFIEKASHIHNGKYDYSKVEYVDSLTDVTIICPEHGEFTQTPQGHARGRGCPKCANKKRGGKDSQEDFVRKAEETHGKGKYDYSKVVYNGAANKVTIICPIHGEFEQAPVAHITGQGCPKCAGRGLTQDEIISLFKDKHKDKYDYLKVVYTKMHDKVIIGCPEHGDFEQTPSKHLLGQGCPKCAVNNRAQGRMFDNDTFICRSKELYGDLYDYSETEYTGMNHKVEICCKKHGKFTQRPFDHLHGHGCPKCGLIVSNNENKLFDFVCDTIGKENVIQGDRSVLDGFEIDIYIPSMKIGIEYNGLKWHSEKFRDKNYHLWKTEECNKKGVKLIHIFDDEYIESKHIVESKVKHLLKKSYTSKKVMARKCSVSEIDKDTAKSFLNSYHIQGYKGCTVALGCMLGEELIGVMTFENDGKNIILNRFATNINYQCIGVGSKMFTYYVNKYNPDEVISFADRRWTVSDVDSIYTKMGFKLDGVIQPDYKYVSDSHPNKRHHKFNFRKSLLSKRYGLPMSMTENEMTEKIGYHKIWDCGLFRFKWVKRP